MDKLKKKKATGIDGIPAEAWKFGGQAVREGISELVMQIWEEGDIPKDWKTSVICPIYKKGDQERTENYRGMSLLYTAYKIYILRCWKKIRKRSDEKRFVT